MTQTRRRCELFLREEVPPRAARRQREHVDRLEASGAAVTVDTWPKRVRRWSDAAVLERYEEFADWADARAVRLDPFFSTRGVYSPENGREFDALVLPICCLAVYEGDSLAELYPHADGEATVSVGDGVDRIVEGAERAGTGSAEAAD